MSSCSSVAAGAMDALQSAVGIQKLSLCAELPEAIHLLCRLLGWMERSCIGLLAATGVVLSVLGTTSAVLKIIES